MEASFFRELDAEKAEVFRKWAREHFSHNVTPQAVWHSVVREEWAKIQGQHKYEAHVDNIGNIGEYDTLDKAKCAILETIAKSGRADPHGFAFWGDEVVYEVGRCEL